MATHLFLLRKIKQIKWLCIFQGIIPKKDYLPVAYEATCYNGSTLADVMITPNAVEDRLIMLDCNKSQQPDGIPARVLSELSRTVALPHQCKTVIMTPVFFLKGTHTNPDNYRPIGLICVLWKVLESIVRDVFADYMQANYLLADCQHVFCSKRSRITQLLEVIDDFRKQFNMQFL